MDDENVAANEKYADLSDQEAASKLAELEKKIAEVEDKRLTHSRDFIDLLHDKMALSRRLKRFQEVTNCEMRIRFLEARLRGEEMPRTEMVNLERKERRKRRNSVNTLLLVSVAFFVVILGSIPLLRLMVDAKKHNQDSADQIEQIEEADSGKIMPLPTQPEVIEVNAKTGGQEIDLSKLLEEGRTTVLDFHSAHCPPCVASMPQYHKLASLYPQMKFYAVDVDRPFSDGIDFTSPVCNQFDIHSLPHYMIFDGTKQAQSGREATRRLAELYARGSMGH